MYASSISRKPSRTSSRVVDGGDKDLAAVLPGGVCDCEPGEESLRDGLHRDMT